MTVDLGVAVPGEVLGGGGDPGALVSVDLSGDEFGHGLRIGAEGTDADDRVGGVDVDVGDGCVVLPDAHRAQLGAGDPRGLAGVGDRATRPRPSAIAPGSRVAGLPTRATMPCSWSVEMSTGSPRGRPSEARWMPFDRSAIWCGSRVLCAQVK